MDEKMTLRDQFAMAALQGMLSSARTSHLSALDFPECAYAYADAMLEARKKEAHNAGK